MTQVTVTSEHVEKLTPAELHLLLSGILSETKFSIDGYHNLSGIAHKTLRQIVAGLIRKGYVIKIPVQQNKVVYSFYIMPLQNSPVQSALVYDTELEAAPEQDSPVSNSPVPKSPAQTALVTAIKKASEPVKSSPVQNSPVVDALKAMRKMKYSSGYASGAVQQAMEKLGPDATCEQILKIALRHIKSTPKN